MNYLLCLVILILLWYIVNIRDAEKVFNLNKRLTIQFVFLNTFNPIIMIAHSFSIFRSQGCFLLAIMWIVMTRPVKRFHRR